MSTESTQTPKPSPTITPSSSVISTDTSNSLISINATAQLPVKLTPLNYLSWHAQFNALLLGYDLLGYIDGTHSCPPKPATASPTSPHTLWVRQDQLLLHAILASVSEQIISLIATATTSKVAWDKLNQLYASKAQSRVMGLKEMRRDSKPVSEYLQCVKAIADELALIDVPLSDDDLFIHILNDVGP
ncbi:uncharacterized protein LOC110747119, partial [Prunus avium]|uniref:Uncharacterized protein LOC110747119 n=1 Tax=Prunus avium TaxID=42229 RepID=A0A6P5RMB1_PRUAV